MNAAMPSRPRRDARALRAGQLLLILFAILTGPACTRLAEVPAPSRSQLQAVLAVPPQVSPALLAAEEIEPLAISAEMIQFVEAMVPEQGSDEERLDALFNALRHNAAFAITYQSDATLSGAEAFRQRRANCLAFSAMFIAMARHADIDARFQLVEVPPTWDSQTGDTLVQYQHVNVRVHYGPREGRREGQRGIGVVDFRVDLYDERYPQQLLSDRQALAHYYSNLSMERLFAGELSAAWVAARRALEAGAEQGFVWNNMGIIQRRLGRTDLAETSYRQALVLNPRDWSAAGNLSQIYAQRGDQEEAARLRALADLIKMRNPYYRFALAQRAYRRGAYQEALVQLDAALERPRDDPRFYYLRGLSFWQLGDSNAAISDMEQAIRVATEADTVAVYQQQLRQWQGG